jgi:hypothetical protein
VLLVSSKQFVKEVYYSRSPASLIIHVLIKLMVIDSFANFLQFLHTKRDRESERQEAANLRSTSVIFGMRSSLRKIHEVTCDTNRQQRCRLHHCRRQGRASSQRAPKSLMCAHNYSIASEYCRPTLHYASSWFSRHMQLSECVELNFEGRVLSSSLLFHCSDCYTTSVAEERRHSQSQRTRRRNRSESLHSN